MGQIWSRKCRASRGWSQFVCFVLIRIRAAQRRAWVIKIGGGRILGCQELPNRNELVKYVKVGSEQVLGGKISSWKNWAGQGCLGMIWVGLQLVEACGGIVGFCLGVVGLVVPVHERLASL